MLCKVVLRIQQLQEKQKPPVLGKAPTPNPQQNNKNCCMQVHFVVALGSQPQGSTNPNQPPKGALTQQGHGATIIPHSSNGVGPSANRRH